MEACARNHLFFKLYGSPGFCFLSSLVIQRWVLPSGQKMDSQGRRDLPLNKVSLQVYPSSNIDVTQEGSGTGQNTASVKKG